MQGTNFGSRQLSCLFGEGGLAKNGTERGKTVLVILQYHPCSDLHISLKVYTGDSIGDSQSEVAAAMWLKTLQFTGMVGEGKNPLETLRIFKELSGKQDTFTWV